MVEHWGYVEALARGRAPKYPGMDPDDAVGVALEALVRCSRRWRRDGAPFKPWMTMRVVGAIRDLQRENDPVGRAERRAQREGRETRQSRWGLPSRVPGDVADLEHDGIVHAATQPTALDDLVRAELLARVRRLPRKIADVMERHAFGDEGLREIGESLGLTESRVCQIVAAGRLMLKTEDGA